MIECLHNQEKVIERHLEAYKREAEVIIAEERAKANDYMIKANKANELIAEERTKANENLFSTLVETWKEFGKSIPETIDKLSKKFNLTREEAEAKVLQYWGD